MPGRRGRADGGSGAGPADAGHLRCRGPTRGRGAGRRLGHQGPCRVARRSGPAPSRGRRRDERRGRRGRRCRWGVRCGRRGRRCRRGERRGRRRFRTEDRLGRGDRGRCLDLHGARRARRGGGRRRRSNRGTGWDCGRGSQQRRADPSGPLATGPGGAPGQRRCGAGGARWCGQIGHRSSPSTTRSAGRSRRASSLVRCGVRTASEMARRDGRRPVTAAVAPPAPPVLSVAPPP